jgi:hypothetical protein
MHINLFTTCTSSGIVDAIPELDGKRLKPFRTHSDMIDYWKSTIDAQPPEKRVLASTLYTGVSFRAAQKIQTLLKQGGHTCDLFIMSIGFGLIAPEELIVPYNLSLIFDDSANSASMYRLIEEKINMDLWWEMTNQHRGKSRHPIKEVIEKSKDSINLVCTSATFLNMVASDIWEGARNDGSTVIILGPSNTSQYVKAPKRLLVNGNIFPIDRMKLEGIVAGNKFDQAQRAGIYLVNRVLAGEGTFRDYKTLLNPIAYGNSATAKQVEQINFDTFVAEAKGAGKSEGAALQELINKGHIISSKAFHLLWNPEEAQQILDKADPQMAIKALQNIGLVTPDNEEESTELLLIFKNAIVQGGFTGSLFGAKEIVSWATTYCESVGREIPGKFQSPQKLTHFIKTIGPSMNIYPADNPKVQTASFQVVV